ncbi:MAG TPA: DUF2442 domain-containing protein [Candidatus Limnocylindrales bacterium]|nr:DUF2442 domain-containing protein [Candidatus Limnocylindrales bacterium]
MGTRKSSLPTGASSAVVDRAVAAAHPELGLVVSVRCDAERLYMALTNGRKVSAPLSDFPRLVTATPAQRDNWVIEGSGTEVHWPDVDEESESTASLA